MGRATPALVNPETNGNGLHGLSPQILFGFTPEMQRVRRVAERVAAIRVPVLIRGESGAGKESIARYLHHISPWSEKPFVKVNCAAIPGTLLESELFGYQKGSFTGAYASRPGKFELADGGTILLDEIANIDPGLQAKLLQVLQDGTFCRIGDLEDRRVDVRIICTTNREIEADIERKTFRQDLYYRINVVTLRIPPLRERLEDLPALVDHLLKTCGERFGRNVQPLPSSIMVRFRQHPWPGNIRELENYLKRYVILGSTDSIFAGLEERERLASSVQFAPPPDFSLKGYSKLATQKAEQYLIHEALKNTRWNRKRAAEMLGISYRALLYKMKETTPPQKRGMR